MIPRRSTREPTPAVVARLFDGSAPVALTDGELLARFVAGRDEAAFEGLVARLGPMVLGVARRMLGDHAEADDAFQATFLVLVRRAGSVGRGDLIGPWLHGVAVRVCRKARARAARRQARERTGVGFEMDPPAPPLDVATPFDRAEVRATIDAEIARLPESYRRLVVLSDVEGLTRDEVADRLGWTPNMVRGRLARARSRLRTNLTRRGCTPPGLGDWGPLPWLLTPPPAVIAATARVALATLAPPGRAATLLASASALSLAQGVCQTMTLTSWKFAACGLLAAGTLAAGTAGALRAQAPAPAEPKSPAAQPAAADPKTPLDPSLTVDTRLAPTAIITPQGLLISSRRAALEQQLQEARASYEYFKGVDESEQNLSVDKYMDAIVKLQQAEEALAFSRQERRATVQTLVTRLAMLLEKKNRELLKRIARSEDVSAVHGELIRAQERLAADDPAPAAGPGEGPSQDDRLQPARSRVNRQPDGATRTAFGSIPPADASLKALLEKRLQTAQTRLEAQQAFYAEGRITIDRLIDASLQVMQAKLGLVETPEQRRAAIQAHLDQVEEISVKEHRELEVGRATTADIAEADDALNEARILLAQHDRGGPLQAPLAAPTNPPARPAPTAVDSKAIADLKQARVDLARQLAAAAERLYPAELPAENYLAARRDLLDAELAAATTPAARAAAFRSLIEVAQKLVATTQGLAQLGEKKPSDVLRAKLALIELQARAAEDAAGVNPATADLNRRLTTLEGKVDRVLDILGKR